MRGSFWILGVCAVTVAVSGGCAHPGADIQPNPSPNPVKTSPDPAVPVQSDSQPESEPGPTIPAQSDLPPEPVAPGTAPTNNADPTIVTKVPKPTRAAVTQVLKTHWPDLRLAYHKRTCVQSGDLDGDAKPDVLAIVRRGAELGVILFSTAAGTLRLGAGEQVVLTAEDWELDDAGARVWVSEGTQTIDANWGHLKGIWMSPANRPTPCARAMALGHDALVYTGSDAAEAIIIRDGGFRWVPCGY